MNSVFKLLTLTLHITLGLSLIIILGYWVTNQFQFQRKLIQWWHQRTCRILDIDIFVTGSCTSQPALIVSNHISWIDIIAIGSLTPVRFLSKAEVRKWPIIGWLAASTGTLFIQRGSGKSKAMAKTIADSISSGDSILIFPEATSTNGKSVKGFFPNLFSAATNTNANIQPIALKYTENRQRSTNAPFIGEDSFFNHLLSITKNNNIQVEITFLPPLTNSAKMDKKSLSQSSRNAILNNISSTSFNHDETVSLRPANFH